MFESQLSLAGQSASPKKIADMILTQVHKLVESAEKTISYCVEDEADCPPALDLSPDVAPSDPQDMALVQFQDMLAWDVARTDPDPGSQGGLYLYLIISEF